MALGTITKVIKWRVVVSGLKSNTYKGMHELNMLSDTILIISQSDPIMPSGSTSVALLQNGLLARHFRTELSYPKGVTPLTSMPRRHYAIATWVLRLIQSLVQFEGVVYIIDYTRVGLLTIVVKKVFHRPYRVVNYFGQNNPGPATPKFSLSHPIFAHFFGAFFSTVIKHSDGVIVNPVDSLVSFVRVRARSFATIPGVLIDTNVVNRHELAAARIRKELGLGNRPLVGLVGPFHDWNRPSIDFVRRNSGLFEPEISFMFIGKYSRGDSFTDERVIFVGHVEDFVDYLSACDCLLVPRLARFGGPMNKMVYAMAIGLPVVTNNPEGMSVTNGENVILSQLSDLPREVNRLIQNPGLKEAIGRNARMYVEENYSANANEEKLVSYIGGFMTSKSRGGELRVHSSRETQT